jgi:GTP-binding protein Era
MDASSSRSGYVAIIGRPNAGKSTLLNSLLQQKLTIATAKPQTTRKRILGILTEPAYQIIFLDTPGILDPQYLLQEKMMKYVHQSVTDADVIVHIIDCMLKSQVEEALSADFAKQYLANKKKPTILLINKIDVSDPDMLKDIIARTEASGNYHVILPISAKSEDSRDVILESILKFLPEGPKYYPDDFVSDENERFFVTEIIREKLLELYRDEVPYSCEVAIEDFKERPGKKHYIGALIYVERETQKSIIIGKRGEQIKALGELARKSIEEFLDHPVYLELRVKVKDNWRKNERFLKEFGYEAGSEE